MWTDKGMNLFACVLINTDMQEYSRLYELENYVLKKHANEQLFIKIQDEIEDSFADDPVEY